MEPGGTRQRDNIWGKSYGGQGNSKTYTQFDAFSMSILERIAYFVITYHAYMMVRLWGKSKYEC